MIYIQVKGIEQLQEALRQFPQKAAQYLQAAGQEAAKDIILPTEGLQRYPPETAANMPPTPYYIRGRGMQRAGRRKPEYNDGKSERYGTQWTVTRYNNTATRIANRASYAQNLAGENQAAKMAAKGWRKLTGVTMEKMPLIKAVFQAWINKLIRDVGLEKK